MSLLTVENIVKSYFHKTVLDNVSFRIQEGDRLGFIGPNGAGKTTLFKIITGQESPEQGQIIKPSNVILGYLTQHIDDSDSVDFPALRNRELEDIESQIHMLEIKMGTISDHESVEYKTITSKYSGLIAKFESLDGYAYERNMKETLQGLGLSEDAFTRPFSSLSGGEKMRVALARILLTRPDILLLDEPTNHLDVSAMEWLEDYLSKFKGAMILISHDRYFLDKVTNQTAELDGGKLFVKPGNYTKYMAQKSIELEFAQKELERIEKELVRQTQVKQTMLSHRNMSGYHAREKVVDKLADELYDARIKANHSLSKKMNFKFLPKEILGDPKRILVQADLLGKSFDSRNIFSNVSFQIKATDKIVLVGPNGCGKSTLLSVLLGQIPDFEGSVKCSSQLKYAHMGQHVLFDDENNTPLEEFLERCDCTEGQARSSLARFGFIDVDCFKKIGVLSGGERSRLYLACLLQEMPDVLFLDEPTNHLDIPSREILEKALSDFNGAIFAISHDRYFIEKCARKIYGFINQSLSEFDSYELFRVTEKKIKSAPASNSQGTNLYNAGFGGNNNNNNNNNNKSSSNCNGNNNSNSNCNCNNNSNGNNTIINDGNNSERNYCGQSEETIADKLNLSPAKARQNKAEERRTTAQRRDAIRKLEQSISEMEDEKAVLEASFGSGASTDDYQKYADLLVSIDSAYEKYMELQDEENSKEQ